MPLPDCATIEATDAGADGWKHPDCRLMFRDQSGMAIEARYTPAEDDSTKITVQVVAPVRQCARGDHGAPITVS